MAEKVRTMVPSFAILSHWDAQSVGFGGGGHGRKSANHGSIICHTFTLGCSKCWFWWRWAWQKKCEPWFHHLPYFHTGMLKVLVLVEVGMAEKVRTMVPSFAILSHWDAQSVGF